MKQLTSAIVLVALMVGMTLVAAACSNDKKSTANALENRSVTDVAPLPATPVVTATPVQPAPSDTPVVSAEPAGKPVVLASAGGSYTVKRGDTLSSIARAKYGDSKQYKKIVAANPGIVPDKIKPGQTLILP